MKTIPVIDIFAGPGGLGEGFSSVTNERNEHIFKIVLSVEKEPLAHRTLTLRSFFRQFIYKNEQVPDDYYKYISGDITRDALFQKHPVETAAAKQEAICAELGDEKNFPYDTFFDNKISAALNGCKNWVLIGGPPCQAYSLVGRSRQIGGGENKREREKRIIEFEKDDKHTLYKQYLRIIARHSPAVFIMENVKGILSSKLQGNLIFPTILKDLRNPFESVTDSSKKDCKPYNYEILSFVSKTPSKNDDYVIKSENYGIPQARHRVILLGIREDFYAKCKKYIDILNPETDTISVWSVIGDLPPLRSGISKQKDNNKSWHNVIKKIPNFKWYKQLHEKLRTELKRVALSDKSKLTKGGNVISGYTKPTVLCKWYSDSRMSVICNHEARSHIAMDIIRYAFVSCYGKVNKKSPSLEDFPNKILPKHKNIDSKNLRKSAFADRFRVQVGQKPASTITCHISKDGHYFIHPDPSQVRSLTVREAARLQTFPDNYFFEGERTAQYHQVGNAVPPLLANKIGEIIARLFVHEGE